MLTRVSLSPKCNWRLVSAIAAALGMPAFAWASANNGSAEGDRGTSRSTAGQSRDVSGRSGSGRSGAERFALPAAAAARLQKLRTGGRSCPCPCPNTVDRAAEAAANGPWDGSEQGPGPAGKRSGTSPRGTWESWGENVEGRGRSHTLKDKGGGTRRTTEAVVDLREGGTVWTAEFRWAQTAEGGNPPKAVTRSVYELTPGTYARTYHRVHPDGREIPGKTKSGQLE